jgi:hypothetical protein
MKIRRWIATGAILLGLLAGGLGGAIVSSPASADCTGDGGGGNNSVGIGNIGGSGNCPAAP